MVMEAPPSPQSVGREFVRQYYTLLNKAPNHLHRFYNHHSSFVHGGLDPPNRETSPVIGQKQIHQKIQQLNFRDCHAKITQVDSQATLGNGVVVQVSGELSNAGQPMRRFTQTFVLASQTPKKFYVHNDIFRYQDEIISDEECEPEARSEPEDEPLPELQVLEHAPPPPAMYFQPPMPAPVALIAQPPVLNGGAHVDELAAMQVAPQSPPQMVQSPPQMAAQGGGPEPEEAERQEVEVVEEAMGSYGDEGAMEGEGEGGETGNCTSNEPKTYANLLKGGNAPLPFNNTGLGPVPAQVIPRAASPTSLGPRGDQQGNRNNLNRGPRINQQQRIPKQDSGKPPGRNSFNEDDDRRRQQGGNPFGDANQLFLGNLPHNASDEELRDIFAEFGAIFDLRVHNVPPMKMPQLGGRAPPSYGFITYESPSSVQACLAAKPIFYPKYDSTGTQLNVEEKKVRDRQNFGRTNPSERGKRDGRDMGQRRSGPGGQGPHRNGANGGGAGAGLPPNRTNTYNRSSGGPPNRGSNNYNRR